ncbi:tyrosine-type recombinase/integrase [Lacrimispora xylanisolvens]|uniref:tyrosine-type recombinase/integrase n=1 Tax=Lacrimispora xylanisolvens TaxID=384636 RepID=UPI002402D19B
MKNNVTSLAYIVSRFFRIYLPGERGFSQATIASYRDTFKQLLTFCKNHLKKPPEKLLVSDISKDIINEFLRFLEAEGKSISTRNQRLAGIKCFFSYIKYSFPEYLDVSSSVLQIRMKKQPEATVNYMSVDGVASVLSRPNVYSKSGYRDALILTMLYDSGARVSEITEIRIGDIRLQSPATIVLHGKGSKDRIVPLSSKSADLIDFYLKKENFILALDKQKFLFTNRSGAQLTRAGVAYILKKYIDMARVESPDLIPDKFSPHCMRHSKAIHLLQAGVAIIYIRDFLGHESVKTTEVYAKADGKSKRAALDAAYSVAIGNIQAPTDSWNSDDSLMRFLTDLCGH